MNFLKFCDSITFFPLLFTGKKQLSHNLLIKKLRTEHKINTLSTTLRVSGSEKFKSWSRQNLIVKIEERDLIQDYIKKV